MANRMISIILIFVIIKFKEFDIDTVLFNFQQLAQISFIVFVSFFHFLFLFFLFFFQSFPFSFSLSYALSFFYSKYCPGSHFAFSSHDLSCALSIKCPGVFSFFPTQANFPLSWSSKPLLFLLCLQVFLNYFTRKNELQVFLNFKASPFWRRIHFSYLVS